MTLGIVARADQSGLAQLCEQVIARLDPDRILVVSLGHLNRGRHDPHRYDGPGRRVFHVTQPNFDPANVHGFLGGLDHVWAAETFYDPTFPALAVQYGVQRHLYAMPELYAPDRPELAADHVWIPAPVNDGRKYFRTAKVLPWWTPDVPRRTLSGKGPVAFVHPTGSAMADRNGTASLIAAVGQMKGEATVTIVGQQQVIGDEKQIGDVLVTRIPRVDHWTDLYTLGDVLVLPRRYGWLSLPMFEAAAYGLPVITTDVWPQSNWFSAWDPLLVRTVGGPAGVWMKGGSILVHTADPIDLGAAMDHLATEPKRVAEYGEEFGRWATRNAWPTVATRWKAAFAVSGEAS